MEACRKMADAGIPLGNQSVLLRGVNDCKHIMRELVHLLVKNRVRPYYIYICDLSMGIEHFRTPVSGYRDHRRTERTYFGIRCSYFFVVDAPGGGGKTPVMPQYVISQTPHKVILRKTTALNYLIEEAILFRNQTGHHFYGRDGETVDSSHGNGEAESISTKINTEPRKRRSCTT